MDQGFEPEQKRTKTHKVEFPCNKCDYVATTTYILKRHAESKHEGQGVGDQWIVIDDQQVGPDFGLHGGLRRPEAHRSAAGTPAPARRHRGRRAIGRGCPGSAGGRGEARPSGRTSRPRQRARGK